MMRRYDPRFRVNVNQTPVHAPATGEYRESWGVENPYGTMIWFESAEAARDTLMAWAADAQGTWRGLSS